MTQIIGKPYRCLSILLLLSTATGCSFIASFFPDKERDYQFRNEIPELVIPEDLQAHNLQTSPSRPSPAVSSAPESGNNPVEAATVKPAPVSVDAATPETPAVQVEVSKAATSSLQIDQAQNQAWRLVGRALARQNIEIVERNLDKAYFYVKYDPDAVQPKDDSIWDEMTFLFGDDPSHEQEYRISLLQTGPQSTEVTVQNSTGKTVSDRTATHLLKLITDGIDQDISTEKPDEKPAKP